MQVLFRPSINYKLSTEYMTHTDMVLCQTAKRMTHGICQLLAGEPLFPSNFQCPHPDLPLVGEGERDLTAFRPFPLFCLRANYTSEQNE
jgi:hypothetical protein